MLLWLGSAIGVCDLSWPAPLVTQLRKNTHTTHTKNTKFHKKKTTATHKNCAIWSSWLLGRKQWKLNLSYSQVAHVELTCHHMCQRWWNGAASMATYTGVSGRDWQLWKRPWEKYALDGGCFFCFDFGCFDFLAHFRESISELFTLWVYSLKPCDCRGSGPGRHLYNQHWQQPCCKHGQNNQCRLLKCNIWQHRWLLELGLRGFGKASSEGRHSLPTFCTTWKHNPEEGKHQDRK